MPLNLNGLLIKRKDIEYFWEGPNDFASIKEAPKGNFLKGQYNLQVRIGGCLSTHSLTEVKIFETKITLLPTPGDCNNPSIIRSQVETNVENIEYVWKDPNGFLSNNSIIGGKFQDICSQRI